MLVGLVSYPPIVILAVALAMAATVNPITKNTDPEGDDSLAKAMASTSAAIPGAAADATRPTFHFHAPALWMNDPNGPIYYKGWYHVFYQFNPYGDQWGHMHWGHARSRDLVDWEHLPIALWPSKSKGEDHVYSGSTHLSEGKPEIFYTSIGGRDPEQWSATPEDANLIRWSKSSSNPVVSTRTHSPVKIDEWRDPYLFDEGGKTYMVTGGRFEGRGIVAAYEATNASLTGWRYRGILFQHPDSSLVECPNLAKFGDRWLLLTSHDGRVDWFAGKLDVATMRFTSEHRGVMDDGSYASQLLKDAHGRWVHLAWVPTSDRHGWNGFLTLPSVLTLSRDGTPLRRPVQEFEKLREAKTSIAPFDLAGEKDLSDEISGDRLEIVADIDPGTAERVEIRLLASQNGERAVSVAYDSKKELLQTQGRAPAHLAAGSHLRLRVFVDRSALDVYAGEGELTQSSAFQPTPGDAGLRLVATGGTAHIRSIIVYRLRAASFTTTAFGLR